MQSLNSLFYTIVVMLFVGMAAGRLAKFLRLPDVVLFLLAGILIGPPGAKLIEIGAESPQNELIIVFGTAYILFHGGLALDLTILRKVALSVGILATVGVLISAAIVGVAFWLLGGGPLVLGFLLGAVIAPTDPASLIPLFERVNVEKKLEVAVKGEAGFNDPMSAVLVFVILPFVTGENISLSGTLAFLLNQVAGSIIVGVAAGCIVAILISDRWGDIIEEYAPIAAVATVLVVYLIASHFRENGYLAVFVSGIMIGNLRHLGLRMRPHDYLAMRSLSNQVFQVMKMFIFIVLGSHFSFAIVREHLGLSCMIVLLLVLVIRPASVMASLFIARGERWSGGEKLFLCWIRETGVMSAALASLLLSRGLAAGETILGITSLTILFTLTIQASTTPFVARRLGVER